MSGSKRDKYYKMQSSYCNLTEWKQLLDDFQISAAISYWNAKGLKATDSYVKIRDDSWVPVLYYCCLKAENADMVKVLLKQGADPGQLPDSDTACLLPFVCHSLYLKTIASRNKRLLKYNNVLKRSLEGRINSGDARRLAHLVTLKFITANNVKEFINDYGRDHIILDKLQTMVKYLTFTYNIKTQQENVINLTEETTNIIKKFHNVVWYLLQHGATVNTDTMKFCIDHYLHEIIPLFKDHDIPTIEPQYHTQMDSAHVAIIRPLLNDQRYVLTCAQTGYTPDPDVFNLNIMN